MSEGRKIIASNRKVYFNYAVEETFEAGVVLTGSEVKSIRAGSVQLADCHALERGGEIWVYGVNIATYPNAGPYNNHTPDRPRKLLLHKREIDKLVGLVAAAGKTIIPLSMYFKDGRVKLEIAVCKHKKLHDKRAAIKERMDSREMARARKIGR
ncbi:MAG: SsrA-binding protein [Myxococcota bacterium]|nr:SsrA-binding protein [Myxococcota bacterium]